MYQESEMNFIYRNVLALKKNIMNDCESLEDLSERAAYLRKVINDCERIIDLAEVIDDEDLDGSFVKNAVQDVDENLILFLNGESEKPQGRVELMVKDSSKYYVVTKAGSRSAVDLKSAIDGLKSAKEILENEFTVIEAVGLSESGGDAKNIERMKVKSSLTDVVRIFEAMKESEIISNKTPVKEFAAMFFHEPTEKYLFERNYNATKSRLKNDGSSSNSDELVEFII